MEKYIPGVGITAGSLMLKWDLLNQHIKSQNIKIEPGDTINIFINFECILKNLINYKNIQNLINFHKQQFVIELEAAILNLIANYRMYFKKEKTIPKIYLYYSSLAFKKQQMQTYNKFYRSYYKNQYIQNPQYRQVGEIMKNIVIPEIKLILSYVPDCYFIESKTFDSSIIPLIVSNFSNNKNIILSSDIFDTLYMFNPNFITIYVKRRYAHFNVISNIDETVTSIIKDENPFDLTLFNSEMYYKLLLSIKGSKIRNIKSAKGFGYGKFLKILQAGMLDGVILKDFESIDSIIEMFPIKYRSDIKCSFQCVDLNTQFELLSETDIDEIKNQIIDQLDQSSIVSLNNKRFLDYPINLQGLLE